MKYISGFKFLLGIWFFVFPFLHITTVEHNLIDDDCQVCSVIGSPQLNSDCGSVLISIIESNFFINNSTVELNPVLNFYIYKLTRAPPKLAI